MIEAVGNIFGSSMLSFAHIYAWHCLEERKINYKSYEFYIAAIIYIILIVTSVIVTNKFIRVMDIMIISILINHYLIRGNIKRTMMMIIITQFVIMLAEMAIVIIMFFLGVDMGFVNINKFGGFAIDTSVAIIVTLIFLLSSVLPKIYKKILKVTDRVDSEYFIVLVFVVMLIANILVVTIYQKVDYIYLLIFNSVVTVVYFVIIIYSFSNRNRYLKVYDKYNTTLSSLKEYEGILDRYRVSNHENKNELMTIRNMIKNGEKDIPEYIDKIVENKLKDNEHLMGQSSVIPEGGLRGLVYSKMLLMKEHKVDFDLSIDRGIKRVQLLQLGDRTVLDICKIIGVFLDNAIEAVSCLGEKFIDLEMSIENRKLYISVSNNYEGTILVEEIENHGYTTKGKGHGYGLTLVKKLVDENPLLKREKEITREEFTQRLIVDVSKLK